MWYYEEPTAGLDNVYQYSPHSARLSADDRKRIEGKHQQIRNRHPQWMTIWIDDDYYTSEEWCFEWAGEIEIEGKRYNLWKVY